MQTFLVQAILGDAFEDLYVTAASAAEAIAKAKTMTTLRHRFTRFAI
jgi:hypothetical protein